jgi:hypothetical protein
MRYMIMVKAREDVGAPPPQLLEAMARGMAELMQSGVMVEAGALLPSAAGARVRLAGDRVAVTDGPFTEATELVGGYSIVQVDRHEEAVALGRRLIEIHQEFWPGWRGEAEVRRLAEPTG